MHRQSLTKALENSSVTTSALAISLLQSSSSSFPFLSFIPSSPPLSCSVSFHPASSACLSFFALSILTCFFFTAYSNFLLSSMTHFLRFISFFLSVSVLSFPPFFALPAASIFRALLSLTVIPHHYLPSLPPNILLPLLLINRPKQSTWTYRHKQFIACQVFTASSTHLHRIRPTTNPLATLDIHIHVGPTQRNI